MRLRSIILVLAACITSMAAHAQPIQGIYISLGSGLRIPLPTKNTSYSPGISGEYNINQKLGLDGELSLGYALGDGWRFELEATAGRSKIDGTTGTRFPATGSGTVRNLGVMANALFDLDIRSPYVYPYFGGGVGYQSTRLDGFTLNRVGRPTTFTAGGDAGGFAMQAILGLSFPVPNVPGLSLTADYRFMDILAGDRFSGSTSFGPGTAAVASSTKFHNQFNQTVMFGVRFAFNTPAPATTASQGAQAAPAGQTQSYLVDFGPNKSTLSDHAQGVVKEAALDSAKPGTTRIQVTGGDTDPAVHAGLSERRARAVAGALIGEGVPREAIIIVARGDVTASGSPGRRIEIVAE